MLNYIIIHSFHCLRKDLPGSRPLGETRPAWKVLRVLGNLMGIAGFDFDSAEEVRSDALRGVELSARLSNAIAGLDQIEMPERAAPGVQRIADVPIYFADPLVRRAQSLQQTRDAAAPVTRETKNPALVSEGGA